MQTCPECGSRNEDGELFCGTCGTYLEWEETQAASAAGGAGPDDGGAGDGAADVDHDAAAGGTAPSGGDSGSPPAEVPSPAGRGSVSERPTDERPPVPARAQDAAPDVGAAPAEEAVGARAAAEEPEPVAGPAAAAAPGAGVLGGLGGRAARAARRAADQATGGAVSTASGTASRARSQTRSVTQSPGRAVVDQAARAAGGGSLAQAAAGAAREARAPAATAPAAAGGAATAAPSAPERRTRERDASARPRDAEVDGPPVAAPAQPSPTRPAKPAPRQPAARKPGAPVQRRPVPQAQEEEPPPRPGELVCGACGAGNAPHRHFCRRCGADLADAPVQPQRSWWRRLLRSEPRTGPAAGTRPRSRRRRRFPTALVVTIVVLGLLGAGAWYARDSLAGAYDAVVDRVAGDDPVNPAEVTASSARADRPAAYVRDGIRDRSWAPEGDGIGESVELVLSEPVRLVTVLVTAGNGGEEDQRLLEARPREVRLTMTTTAGEEVQDVELTDTGEPQPVSVGLSDVERVRLTILSVYGEELGAPVALAEVELQGRG
ncbi:hypothetical protein SAMN05216184_10867 [Georgenia satyanarayanai]|uniref:Zinc-ribbon domain-containing protein n=1 Tax=Georgenia satyanarayanai TaxID=860221 RepID=A0A2Y9C6N0_9MICO|nr:zinc-ribbon domain-containing protein [Georgenia satyanarayanai]PYF99185.1 hypothetical protein A8987_10867 [Georgenia satyanarayanai]SSA43303.1 hypothetical protein SAMN05216184_10867 [Georgenia satyanarayanai]